MPQLLGFVYLVLSQEMMTVNLLIFLGVSYRLQFFLTHSFCGGMTGRCKEVALSFQFDEHLPSPHTPAFPSLPWYVS